MSTVLLDANTLIALTVLEHEHHEPAAKWLAGIEAFATCPVVEGELVRFLLRLGEGSETATALLRAVRAHPRARFWPDRLSYLEVDLAGVRGHRQVTDSYLTALAASHGSRLATFDRALAALRPDQTLLIG